MAFIRRKTKHKNGFTLPEVLVVVALLAVLLAFAVPAILGYVRRLKLRALDTDAQSIFMAAQDRLTAMADSGELDLLLTNNTVTVRQDADDDPDVTTGELTLTYLSSDDTGKAAIDLQSILPFGAIESKLRAGHYVVEFSKATGAVYGVWYTDEDGYTYTPGAVGTTAARTFAARLEKDPLVGYYGNSTVDRPDVNSLPAPHVSLLNAEVLRLRVTIPTVASDSALNGKPVTVEVGLRERDSSGDFLWLPLPGTDPAAGPSPLHARDTGAATDVTGDVLLDAAYPREAETALYGGAGGTCTFTDTAGVPHTATLLGCQQFRQWVHYTKPAQIRTSNPMDPYPSGIYEYDASANTVDGKEGPRIDPGSDITVAVRLVCEADGRKYESEMVFVHANSLFSALAKNDPTAEHPYTTYTARLTYCRHLQNLCAHVNGDYSTVTTGGYTPFLSGLYLRGEHDGKTVNLLTGASLIRDLDFADQDADDPARSWLGSYGYDTKFNGKDTYDPSSFEGGLPHRFESIYCNSAFDLNLFDGGGLSIRNLNTDSSTKDGPLPGADTRAPNVGLFGFIVDHISGDPTQGIPGMNETRKVTDLTLVNAWARNGRRAGSLAAAAKGAVFSNCSAYLSYTEDGTPFPTGSDGKPLAHVCVLEGSGSGPTESAGGLIGQTTGCTLTSCSAATVVKGRSDGDEGVGGLIGRNRDDQTTLTNCQAACHLLVGTQVGGLVGQGPMCSFSNCYAAGYIDDVNVGSYSQATGKPNAGLAAGLVCSSENGFDTAGNVCYSAVRYSPALIQKVKDADPDLLQLYPTSLKAGNKGYYIEQTGVPYTGTRGQYGVPLTTEQLTEKINSSEFSAAGGWYTPADGANPTYAVFPYHIGDRDPDVTRLDTPYPYPQLALELSSANKLLPPGTGVASRYVPMVHYGDWMESDGEVIPAYYERYATGTGPTAYGFYTTNGPDGTLVNTLRVGTAGGDSGAVGTNTAVADGYALLVPAGTGAPASVEYAPAAAAGTPTYQTLKTFTTGAAPDVTGVTLGTGGDTYDVYILPVDPAAPANPDEPGVPVDGSTGTYYYTLRVNGIDIAWFNPHFACEAHAVPDTVTAAAADMPLAKPGAAGYNAAVTPGAAEYAGEVIIRTARQLVRLSEYTNNAAAAERTLARARTYRQLLDMDFPLYTAATLPGAVDITKSSITDPAAAFTPICLTGGRYYGGRHIIRRLYITPAVTNDAPTDASAQWAAGVFGIVESSTAGAARLEGIRLLDIKVNTCNTAGETARQVAVGALAGVFRGEAIVDCGVYCSYGTSFGDHTYYRDYGIASNATNSVVGGLVGKLEAGQAQSSFAAVKLWGMLDAGGFAGTVADGVTVQDCYAGGYTTNNSYMAPASSVDIANVGTTTGHSGGFAGELGSVTFKGICYTTCSVRGTVPDNMGLFAGAGTPAALETLYATGITLQDGKPVTPHTEDYLTLFAPEAQRTGDWFTTTAYDSALHTGTGGTGASIAYPYASNLAAHHGDWVRQLALVYYEKYTDTVANDQANAACGIVAVGTAHYGFCGQWKDARGNSHSVNTLAEAGTALDSGYAFILPAGMKADDFSTFVCRTRTYSSKGGTAGTGGEVWANDITADTDAGAKPEEASVLLTIPAGAAGGLAGQALLTLPFKALNQAPTDNYYRPILINGMAAAYNPHFACEALNLPNGTSETVTVSGGPADGQSYTKTAFDLGSVAAKTALLPGITAADTVLIRTPWNLASMARYTREGNNAKSRANSRAWHYRQLLDLDFDGATYAGGVYDGWQKNQRKDAVFDNKYLLDDTTYMRAGSRMRDAKYNYDTSTVSDVIYWMSPAQLGSGSYDGRGHTIRNLYVGYPDHAEDSANTAGLFCQVDSGTVENIILRDLHVHGNAKTESIGGVAALVNGGTLESVTLRDLTVQAGENTVNTGGAVGRMDGGTLKDVDLTTASVTLAERKNSKSDGDETCVGGLVGYAGGAKLEGCTGVNLKVNAKVTGGKGNARVGGLVGRLAGNSTATGCGLHAEALTTGTYASAAAAYDDTGVTFTDDSKVNNDYVGGFAGDINTSTVTDCYAAVKVTGKKYVGGFAGQLNNATAEDCYSGGCVVAKGRDGYDYQAPVPATADYANVTATADGAHVGGFAGQAAGTVTLRGICYTTCSVYSTKNDRSANEQYMGLFFGAMSKGGAGSVRVEESTKTGVADKTPLLYAGGGSFAKDAKSAVVRNEEAYDLFSGPHLRDAKPTATPAPAITTHTYGVPTGAKFPYRTNLTDHYGDWRQPVTYAGALYWEKENRHYSFAVAATDSLGQAYTVDLPDHGHDDSPVTEWGYGAFYAGNVDDETLTLTPPTLSVDETIARGTDDYASIQTAFQAAFGTNDPDTGRLELWKSKDVRAVTGGKADTVTVIVAGGHFTDNKVYTLNRAFAAAMEDTSDRTVPPTLGTAGNPYQIRTLGQLANINGAENLYFKQTHDLDMAKHNAAVTDDYTHAPLTMTGAGGYDGGGYRIVDLTVDGTASSYAEYVGLFGQLGAGGATSASTDTVTLQNIILYAPKGDGAITTAQADKAAGGLVGAVLQSANVTINNCAVAGYTLSADARDAAGGLVGSVYGPLTVTNSQAVTDLTSHGFTTARSDGAGPGLGGLVGFIYRDAGTVNVENSYAGGRVVDGKAADPGTAVTTAPDYAGGLVGTATGSGLTVTIKNTYAYMTGTKSGLAGAGVDGAGVTVKADTCAYLQKDSQTDDGGKATNKELTEWVKALQAKDAAGNPVKDEDGNKVMVFGAADQATYVPESVPDDFVLGHGLTPNDGTDDWPVYPFGAIVTDPRLADQVDDDTGLPLDAHVHYGTWPEEGSGPVTPPGPGTLPTGNDDFKQYWAILAVYENGDVLAWFPSTNTDSDYKTFRMWKSNGSTLDEQTLFTTIPDTKNVLNIGIIMRGVYLKGSNGFEVYPDAAKTSSTKIGDKMRVLYKGPADGNYTHKGTQDPSSSATLPKDFNLPTELTDLGYINKQVAWVYSGNASGDNALPTYKKSSILNSAYALCKNETYSDTNLVCGPFTLTLPSDITEETSPSGDPPVGDGPSMSGLLPDGPEIFDDPPPTATPTPTPDTATPETAATPAPTPEAAPAPTPTLTPTPAPTPETTPGPTPAPETTPGPTPAPETTPGPTTEMTPEPPPGPTAGPAPEATPAPGAQTTFPPA